MGRRKKEPRSVHRENIAKAAQELFMVRGMSATSVDDIAKAAGYSKATLYVYFEDKEEIICLLVLKSMKKLQEYLSEALKQQVSTKEKYHRICLGLVRYQEEFPFYFQMALDKINIEMDKDDTLPEEKETYRVGERINEQIKVFLKEGIEKKEIREDIDMMPAIFTFWGMLSGFILMAVRKEAYIAKEMAMSKQEFLEYGFETLFRSIEK